MPEVKVLKIWQMEDGEWTIPGTILELDSPLPYLEAGLVIPVRKRKIETAIRHSPEAIKESISW